MTGIDTFNFQVDRFTPWTFSFISINNIICVIGRKINIITIIDKNQIRSPNISYISLDSITYRNPINKIA
ncbi:hypothetical protein D3C81_1120310 [compost metagenome]